ncbi:hypothetical protein AVEN_135599-1 [Araneus ventricosus]|uniref:Uncharacterized protein n=1 Tax=Araneus ventricosus TaxID=182803 RepID=A0A4Y2DQT2_ARAVE|nr:hypothetical protein AVEN_135599-1 [Araneus ventricosus]
MAGLTKTVAVFWTLLIFSTYSAVSIDPESFKKDIMTKLNLQEETLAQKYYESFTDYMKQVLELINSLGDKGIQGIENIMELSDKLTNTYWFRCVQGYFVTGIPQPIKQVVNDFKDSEAVEDAHDFILSWIWNPIRNINVTEIEETLRRDLRKLQESDALRPHAILGQYFLDAYNKVSMCCCRDALLAGEKFCKQQWSEMPLVGKLLWFIIGFVFGFVITYVYSYVMELKEEFNTYEEFLEAVAEQEYPLDKKNKESHKHGNPFDDEETIDED